MLKLKGIRACQDLYPSLTRRQVTRLQLKTIVERSTAVIVADDSLLRQAKDV
jgi:hypothetical protein